LGRQKKKGVEGRREILAVKGVTMGIGKKRPCPGWKRNKP